MDRVLLVAVVLSILGLVTSCSLPANPTQADYVQYIMCMQTSTGYTTDGGRWGRSVDNVLHSKTNSKQRSKKGASCVLKENAQQKDYVDYVLCLQGNGYTSDGGRWGRSVDRVRKNMNGINEKKSKRSGCQLKENPQQSDYINYMICLQSNGYTSDGGRWGRSVDSVQNRNAIARKVEKRAECKLASNPKPQDYVTYLTCLQNNGYTSDGGRWGRSTDRVRHYRVLDRIFRNNPNIGRLFHLRRSSKHEEEELPTRQVGRDDNNERVLSRILNGRVRDLGTPGVTIIEHPIHRRDLKNRNKLTK